MTEADGRRWLKAKLARCAVKFQPIESGGTGFGIPDIYARTRQHECWIELKIGKYIGMGVRTKFRPGQLLWIRDYASFGARIKLLLFVPHLEGKDFTWWVFHNEYIKEAYTMQELTELGKGFLTGQVTSGVVFSTLFSNP